MVSVLIKPHQILSRQNVNLKIRFRTLLITTCLKNSLLIFDTIINPEIEIIVPSGDSIIIPKDRAVIFARKHAIPKVEKMLAAKLEFI